MAIHRWGKQTVPNAGQRFAPSVLTERKCHQQISLAAIKPSLRLSHLVFLQIVRRTFMLFCLASSFPPVVSSLVFPPPTSHALSTSSRVCLSVFLSRSLTSYLLLSGQMSSGHRWRADGTHARLKRPQVEGRERKGDMLRQCLLIIYTRLNDASLSPLFCRPPRVARLRRSEPKGQWGQPPPNSLPLRPCLFTAFYCQRRRGSRGVGGEVWGGTHIHMYTQTGGEAKKKNSLSSQSYRQGCYSNSLSYLWAEHLYSISINACTPRDETNTNMLKLLY